MNPSLYQTSKNINLKELLIRKKLQKPPRKCIKSMGITYNVILRKSAGKCKQVYNGKKKGMTKFVTDSFFFFFSTVFPCKKISYLFHVIEGHRSHKVN